MRREEGEKQEQILAAVEEQWKQERQELFKKAHENQLRAIARQNSILEKRLRDEFANTLTHTQEQHSEQLKKALEKAWEEAEKAKNRAVLEARQEEQTLAKEEAMAVAERVAMERKAAEMQAEKLKKQALVNQRQHMEEVQQKAVEKQQQELERQFEARLSEVCIQYEAKLNDLQHRLDEQLVKCQCLEEELQSMTDLKTEWEQKHANVKQEFSDFIDQFPGFRGEFLLK